MKRLLTISSPRHGLRLVVALTLAVIVTTLVASDLFCYLLDIPTTWKQYLVRVVIPLVLTPVVVTPLIGMNIRLNRMRAEMDSLARTDPLTGLPNRRAFFARANEIFALLQGHEPAAVLMIDIDRFKGINDRFGHDAGDAVLKSVAQAIVAAAAECGAHRALAARIGGEEFAVVIDGFGADDAAALASRVCERVRAAATVCQDRTIAATVSVGVAARRDVEPIDVVLKAADTAVYEAKERGRDRWCVARPAAVSSGKGASHELRAQPRAA
jgi:diguanylate cyclase (GGDEF)-like protein